MVKPKKDPMGDEYIPNEESPDVDEPKKKDPPKKDPDQDSNDKKLPPDPEQPDAPIKK